MLKPRSTAAYLSPWVGQTVRLRFAAADTLVYLSVAVDDVQLVPYAQENRAGYCSAPGNASNGHELAPGSFLDLVVGQPSVDPQYAAATTARWIDGLGITCDNVPAGFTEQARRTATRSSPRRSSRARDRRGQSPPVSDRASRRRAGAVARRLLDHPA